MKKWVKVRNILLGRSVPRPTFVALRITPKITSMSVNFASSITRAPLHRREVLSPHINQDLAVVWLDQE
jgi:hypothetical protein